MPHRSFDHQQLLELDPDGGLIRFAGQRALLLDAMAMGLLRKYLVENFGLAATRTVLTQFGFAHGWRLADSLKTEMTWEKDEHWIRAGLRIHMLQGLYSVGPGSQDPLSPEGVMLGSSYEAEQHMLHFGRADEPVCWTLCGLTSGYFSRCLGKEVFVMEDQCTCRGDVGCHLRARTREDWGTARAADLVYYDSTGLKECLDVSLQRVMETLRTAERKIAASRRVHVRVTRDPDLPLGIVAVSAPMRKLVDLAQRVARIDSTVLITGESGTGKEKIARLVHEASLRATGPFIAVNCGAITETLLESELFGHARGAFTGAITDRAGFFEAAHLGTLLLDEIGEVSPGMQVKLLRVLQEREVRRVGENKSRRVDVRVLAATNRNLATSIAAGTFRQDLYYRLKVVELHVPPLRERPEDILPLAQLLLAETAKWMKRRITGLAPGVADRLMAYDWPGNVRELVNAMERGVALAQGSRVELEDLPEDIRQAVPRSVIHVGGVRSLEDVEKAYIIAALEQNGGNQTHTAAQLRIGSATLYRKLKSYGLIGGRSTPAPPDTAADPGDDVSP
jgi:two-component system response regulator HydG